jgi:hypothetical protein
MTQPSFAPLPCLGGLLISILSIFVVAGCGEKSGENTRLSPLNSEGAPQEPPVTVIASDRESQSPAAGENRLPDCSAAPDMVCKKFVQFLNNEDHASASQLLTPAAIAATRRASFRIPPIGERNAVFEFSDPQYSTIKQQLCFVECRGIEEIDSQELETHVTWMLRKTKPGWRVAGMLVSDSSNGTGDLFSFENIDDIQQIKQGVSDDLSSLETQKAVVGQSSSR